LLSKITFIRVVNVRLGFILFSLFIYFWFSFLLFFILDLDKEYNIILYVIVIQVTNHDKSVIHIT